MYAIIRAWVIIKSIHAWVSHSFALACSWSVHSRMLGLIDSNSLPSFVRRPLRLVEVRQPFCQRSVYNKHPTLGLALVLEAATAALPLVAFLPPFLGIGAASAASSSPVESNSSSCSLFAGLEPPAAPSLDSLVSDSSFLTFLVALAWRGALVLLVGAPSLVWMYGLKQHFQFPRP